MFIETISATDIIMNSVAKPKNNVVNLLVLVAKQYIYRMRCMGGELNFYHLKAEIFKIENLEKFIAVKNNKIAIHNKKWHSKQGINETCNLQSYIQQYNEMC